MLNIIYLIRFKSEVLLTLANYMLIQVEPISIGLLIGSYARYTVVFECKALLNQPFPVDNTIYHWTNGIAKTMGSLDTTVVISKLTMK